MTTSHNFNVTVHHMSTINLGTQVQIPVGPSSVTLCCLLLRDCPIKVCCYLGIVPDNFIGVNGLSL